MTRAYLRSAGVKGSSVEGGAGGSVESAGGDGRAVTADELDDETDSETGAADDVGIARVGMGRGAAGAFGGGGSRSSRASGAEDDVGANGAGGSLESAGGAAAGRLRSPTGATKSFGEGALGPLADACTALFVAARPAPREPPRPNQTKDTVTSMRTGTAASIDQPTRRRTRS
ncbi:MAG TPA: hypothetical protein VM580_21015, partial [Labilithrix sp.]|nr:hypothetical protein [Labilithrix sp.]